MGIIFIVKVSTNLAIKANKPEAQAVLINLLYGLKVFIFGHCYLFCHDLFVATRWNGNNKKAEKVIGINSTKFTGYYAL